MLLGLGDRLSARFGVGLTPESRGSRIMPTLALDLDSTATPLGIINPGVNAVRFHG